MIYLAINHITDDEADYFKFKSLSRAFEYINTNGLSSYTLSDLPFLDDNFDLIPDDVYKVIG